MEAYNVITSPGEGEYTEKKSRFIGHAMSIGSEAEALAVIDQIKRRYWDARHNCYAFITGQNGEILRFSDDGEPGGTAGKPILEVLEGGEFKGALIVVTRYFGGTLLGTGGLVRAYTAAAKEAVANAGVKRVAYSSVIKIKAEYTAVGRLQHYFADKDIKIDNAEYGADVSMRVTVREEDVAGVCEDITQATAGKAEIEIIDKGYFG